MKGVHGFLGACVLTAAILLPHGHAAAVIEGMLLAAALRWGGGYLLRRWTASRTGPSARDSTSRS